MVDGSSPGATCDWHNARWGTLGSSSTMTAGSCHMTLSAKCDINSKSTSQPPDKLS